jgi:hypothetical protein
LIQVFPDSAHIRACRSRLPRFLLIFALACAATACDSPSSPSGGIGAPTLAGPADDALVDTLQPTLRVHNVVIGMSGTRTYDFRVADSQTGLDGPISSSSDIVVGNAIPEGQGDTAFPMPRALTPSKRYYWRARAVQGTNTGPWSTTFRFRTDAPANPPPVITALNKSAERAEVNTEINVSVIAQDAETLPANLLYEWSAPSGTFIGTGSAVRWRAATTESPATVELKVTVVERYQVTDADGQTQTRENRVSAVTPVHVNDSDMELNRLSLTFLDDFVHSERTPEYCVRNFTDSCRGKAMELEDIARNRREFVNNPSQSSFSIRSISYNRGPGQATQATVLAPCRFAATSTATGVSGVAVGTCRLIHVYENFRWFLCESWFDPPSLADTFTKQYIF